MEKDIFNGYIKKEYIGYVKFSIYFASILFLVMGIFFLLVALFYDKVEESARILIYVMAGISLPCSFLYPVLSFYSIRNYDKHKKLARGCIKAFVFTDYEEK